jgi:DNA-binding LytR/AlgR family response regulator
MKKCLLVDDEFLALEIIESYLKQLGGFTVIKCTSAMEAFTILQEKTIDIVFLDIHMPRLTGLDLLKTLKNKPKVIITSAHREYALESFDLDVVDYLLKPVSFERFLQALAKVSFIQQQPSTASSPAQPEDAFIYLKEENKMKKIFIRDILYIESIKDYVKVKLNDKQIVTYQRIGYMQEKLPEDKFVRIHKSFIVALDKIDSYNNDGVTVRGQMIPIGRSYKNQVIEIFNRGNLMG